MIEELSREDILRRTWERTAKALEVEEDPSRLQALLAAEAESRRIFEQATKKKDETTYTLEEAVEYLRNKGRQCSTSKLSRDNRAGIVGRNAKTNRFGQNALDDYAESLKPATGIASPEDLQTERAREEIGRIRAIRKIKEMEEQKLRGELLEREMIDQQNAARLAVLKADLEGLARGQGARLHAFALRSSAAEFSDFLLSEFRKALSRYAQIRSNGSPVSFTAVLNRKELHHE